MFKKILKKIRGGLDLSDYIKNGLEVGENFNMQHGCIIDDSFCELIKIGNNVTLAPRVHILAHDASTKMFLGYTKIGKVTIGNNVFVGANTTILPNTKIGDRVIIGAGSVVTKDIPSNVVVAGNPAKIIMDIDVYLEKNKENMKTCKKYNTKIDREQLNIDLEETIGYIL